MLHGLHSVRKRRADGTTATYHYAWRGGPRIIADPDTPAFAAEFLRLTASRAAPPPPHAGTLTGLMIEHQRSPAFLDLADETRAGYARRIAKIEREFGDTPVQILGDDRLRGDFLDWRDRLATKGRREADYCLSVLARVLSWAHDRRRISANVLARPGRLYSGSRVESVWTDAEVDAVLAAASPRVGLVVQIALWTGQRLGDVLRLTWTADDGAALRLRQGKTGRHLVVPVAAPLRAALESARAARGRAVTICTTTRGRAWTRDGFQSSFARACLDAGVTGLRSTTCAARPRRASRWRAARCRKSPR